MLSPKKSVNVSTGLTNTFPLSIEVEYSSHFDLLQTGSKCPAD